MTFARFSRHLLDFAVFAVIVAVSIAALDEYHISIATIPFQPSFYAVLPDTIRAALKLWTFWGLATVVLGALLLRVAPDLGLFDALLGGALSVWILAYLGGNLVGPLGLCRSSVIWVALAAGAFAVGRHPPPIRRPTITPGQWLMLLAFALVAPGLFLLQLGSPVPPHFDVFAPAAAAQRIVTFGTYLPYDNDPYGYYDAASQCPGVELFYAVLALGSGTNPAVLAETAAILPIVALLIAGTYRFGKSVGGDLAGGFASLLLLATVLFRALPTGHGRYAAFIPVVAGLAFILDSRREPIRLVLGALLLGVAVASHAIIGSFGMFAVGGTLVFWILRGDLAAGLAGIGLLAGATLIALPTVAVAVRFTVPYPVLPLVQLLGIGVIVVAARSMPRRAPREPVWLVALVTLAVGAYLFQYPHTLSTFAGHWANYRYPILWIGGTLGLAAIFLPNVARQRAAIVMVLAAGLLAEYVSTVGVTSEAALADPRVSIAIRDLAFKSDFWYPFALVFPTACLAAALARWLPRRLVVYVVLALLCYPWTYGNTHPGARDPNYYQHSVAEGTSEQFAIASSGYWGSMGDRRWAQSEAELALMDTLRAEIAAGRITTDTHIAHLSPIIYLYRDVVLFSVFVGINDDIFMAQYHPDPSIVGGRIRPAEAIVDALAAGYPYVVIHDETANAEKLDPILSARLALDAYEEIFNQGGVRLYRARAVATVAER